MAKLLDKKFIGNDQVDGTKLLLGVGQTVRKDNGAGGTVDVIAEIETSISDEAASRIAGDSALDAALAQEVLDRLAADSATIDSLETYVDNEVGIVDGKIDQEILDRVAGDASTLTSANSYTDSQITIAQGDLTALEAALDQEILDRVAADSALATLITDGDSSTLAVANMNAQTLVSAEEVARLAADQLLQNQIDSVLSNVDGAALDSLTEIVTAFQAADASLNGAITSLSTGLSADIDAEEAARIAADSALQGEIDAEEIARAAADVTLQNNINAEASARQSADDALDLRVDALEAVVWFKEKFSIVNGQTSVTLSFTPKANSMTAFVDRLGIHEGASEDFTISGTTMTFLNDLVSPGQSQLGNGDTVYVKYQK